MAIYYVAPYGNNTNNGTSAATPWLTIQFALGAASGTNPGLVAGDTVWIAPGTYREVITSTTLTGSAGNTIKIYGDPKFTRSWTSGSPGRVRLTSYSSDSVTPAASQTLALIGDYIEVQDLCLDGNPQSLTGTNNIIEACLFMRGGNLSVTRCVVQTTVSNRQPGIQIFVPTGKNTVLVDKCSVLSCLSIWIISGNQTPTYDLNATVRDCFIFNASNDYGIVFEGTTANQVTGGKVYNNTVIGSYIGIGLSRFGDIGGTSTEIRNNLIIVPKGTGISSLTGMITITQSNNSILASATTSNITPSSVNVFAPTLDFGSSRIQGFGMLPWHAPANGSPLFNAGISTGAPTVDIYGNTWTTTPSIGAIESKTESDIQSYLPTERNCSTITVAPGSTSQSIELYLGTTGLTYQTSGLRAYYVRNRSTPVQITLVNQTNNGAWNSGGFAEIDAVNMPGIYRLDVPNAAFALGSSDVTINVRGAAGTNGAVLTVNLAYTQIDMTQSVPTSNTAHTVGDALNAARAYGFGKWVISGTTLSLYASDNTTVIKTFTLDSGSYPTSRT